MLDLLQQLTDRFRKKTVMGKIHGSVGTGELAISVGEECQNRFPSLRLPRPFQNIEKHLIHPVQIAREVVKTQLGTPPIGMLRI